MRNVHWVPIGAAIAFFGLAGPCRAETKHRLKLDLSDQLAPENLFPLTPVSFEAKFRREGFPESPYLHWDERKTHALFSKQPYANVEVALTILDDVALAGAEVEFREGKACRFTFVLDHEEETTLARIRTKLSGTLGCEFGATTKPEMGWTSELKARRQACRSAKGVAFTTFGSGTTSVTLAPPEFAPSHFVMPLRNDSGGQRSKYEFFVRLDGMLKPPALWNLTPQAFERNLEVPGFNAKETPFYKWNTAAKDSAMLMRHVFGNTSTDLLLFDDEVNAEEISIEFRGGKAGKLSIALLSRGNAEGEITAARFDEVFKATGRALSASLGVRPIRAVPAGKNLAKVEGYLWTTPHSLALMEYNVGAPKGHVEFLRLKMMPAAGRSELLNLAGIGDNATTRGLSSFVSNVKRDAKTGDTYIAGVPMVDQGQKGYCVSASCARMFSYLGVPCDQNDIAELVKNDAERGTDPNVMYAALRKIERQYRIHVKVVKLPRGFGLEGMTGVEIERAQKGDLMRLVQENIGLGVPVLWAVRFPRDPVEVKSGFPNEGAPVTMKEPTSGGHMRMVIGFNAKRGEIIFTDSWGAGHEFKRMPVNDAQAMTQAVFTMQPNR